MTAQTKIEWADHPILFSGPMVRALLDGRKTQTRRVITKQAALDALEVFDPEFLTLPGNRDLLPIRAVIGDRMWVREHWRTWGVLNHVKPSLMNTSELVQYEADGGFNTGIHPKYTSGRHRQGMHMPRWASRLTLIVTDVRVQRLQDISEQDAKAEGVGSIESHMPGTPSVSHVDSFRELWDDLNAKRGFGWDANPWVAAYSFTTHPQNIDKEAG